MSFRTLPRSRRELGELLLEEGAPGSSRLARFLPRRRCTLLSLSAAEQKWVEERGWTPSAGCGPAAPGRLRRRRRRLVRDRRRELGRGNAAACRALPAALPAWRLSLRLGCCRILSWRPSLGSLGCLSLRPLRSENGAEPKRLVLSTGCRSRPRSCLAEAVYFGRDLINTPANDLGPAELEAAARELASEHGAIDQGDEGVEPALREFSDDPCRRPRERPAAAPDRPALGRRARAEGYHHRQGHLLRHRRPRHQAVERHGPDEEGHGRGRNGARARASRDAGEAARAPARADPGRRQCHCRQRLQAGRCAEIRATA